MKYRKLLFTAAVLTVAIGVSFYFDNALAQTDVPHREIGDKAPEISVTDWIQGGPVKLSDGLGKNVYIVEFWATWCPPCRASIPHLNELYQKYKDRGLQVVAITQEDPDSVASFVKNQGDKMTYPVAIDGDGKMADAYMLAFGENGIPHAFVIDTKGKIVWHGHPMDDIEAVIQKYLPKKEDGGTAKS